MIFGGGGELGLGFWSGPRIFFGQNQSKIIFFAGLFFFITDSYIYNTGFRGNLVMLNSGFRYNFMLNLCFRDKRILKFNPLRQIHTQSRFSQQLQTAVGTDNFIVNLTLYRFSSKLHTQIDMTRLCGHHSLIHVNQNSLYNEPQNNMGLNYQSQIWVLLQWTTIASENDDKICPELKKKKQQKCNICWRKAKEKYRGVFEIQKSGDETS